jgi:hypothetical protein
MKTAIALAVAMIFGESSAAHAVYLNPRGTGQVLIFPYYTVNSGYNTLFSIINTTASGKALKLRFHEAYDGRAVLEFNVYLSPFDVWTGALGPDGDAADAPAALLTTDNGCTDPAFPVTPGGQPALVDFRDPDFTGANSDGGPTGLDRTREGHLDVIEMGEIVQGSNTYISITHVNGVPPGCAQVVAAWGAGGYWSADPTTDLAPPSGGLYGAEAIVNVAQGTLFAVNAEALDGFSSVIQNTSVGSVTPDLNTATNSSGPSGVNAVIAEVPVNGQMIQAQFQHPEDAVSALFMADQLFSEYVVDPAGGEQSDWVVTLPTKRFYVDPAIVGQTAVPPFDSVFGADASQAGTSCSAIVADVFDRNELTLTNNFGGFDGGFPPFASPQLCYESNVLTVNSATSVLGSRLSNFPTGGIATGPFLSGHIELILTGDNHALTASSEGNLFAGLPAVGFLAENFVNANVTPGVLANYSATFAHRAHVACSNATTAQNICQ